MKTLIFLHGWAATGNIWQKQTAAFQKRFRVETPTIPTWDPAWLTSYLQQFSLPDCLLVGWSLGGMLLLEALAQEPAPPGGLILVGVAPVFCTRQGHPQGQPPAAVRAMRRALKSNPQNVVQDFALSCLSPNEEAFQEEVTPLFPAGDAAHLATGLDYLLHRDLRPLLPRVTASCTLIQGGQDRIVAPEQARFLHDHLPGSSLRFLPHAGHLAFWTKAGEFNGILKEILGREQ